MPWFWFAIFLATTALYALFSALVMQGLARKRESWRVMLSTVLFLGAFCIALVSQTISCFLEAMGG